MRGVVPMCEQTLPLPWNNSVFHLIHSFQQLKTYFSISYLRANKINRDNHKLIYSTQINVNYIDQKNDVELDCQIVVGLIVDCEPH